MKKIRMCRLHTSYIQGYYDVLYPCIMFSMEIHFREIASEIDDDTGEEEEEEAGEAFPLLRTYMSISLERDRERSSPND